MQYLRGDSACGRCQYFLPFTEWCGEAQKVVDWRVLTNRSEGMSYRNGGLGARLAQALSMIVKDWGPVKDPVDECAVLRLAESWPLEVHHEGSGRARPTPKYWSEFPLWFATFLMACCHVKVTEEARLYMFRILGSS